MHRAYENSTWKEAHLRPRYVYNCYDSNEIIDPSEVFIWFSNARECDMLCLEITNRRTVYLTSSDLKVLQLPANLRSKEFFAKDLAIIEIRG